MKLPIWILFFIFVISANCISDEEDEVSDNEDIIENEELPAHRFVQEEKVVKSGKSKGQKKYITSLVIPPYTFRRKVDKKVVILLCLPVICVKNLVIEEYLPVLLRHLRMRMVNVNMNSLESLKTINVCQVLLPI